MIVLGRFVMALSFFQRSDPSATFTCGMFRSFKYRLHPNISQESVLDQWLRQCAAIYNAGLEQRIMWWRQSRQSICYNDQTVQLTDLRAADPSFRSVPVEVQRSALRRLDHAFAAFFRRCRSGETPGFPRFRATRRYDSFAIGRVSVKNDRVHVPKMNLYRSIGGKIRNATIRRDASGKWWVIFQCDLGEVPMKIAVQNMVGIDLGLSSLATLSTGEKIQNPRFARRAEDQLARRQRDLARKQKRSKNRERARSLVAKAHAHVASQRLDHARKEARKLLDRFDAVAHEDLSLRALARGMLSKSFADASWGLLLRCLASKAEEAGKHVVPVDPRQTSQLCCRCGKIVPKDLSEREHRCICGLTIDRDHNAAINVLARGRRALELAKVNVEREAS
jgi:putative transposase